MVIETLEVVIETLEVVIEKRTRKRRDRLARGTDREEEVQTGKRRYRQRII